MVKLGVFEVRRRNLINFIEEKFEGNRAAFCRATGKNQNLINLCLTTNKDLQRTIGEKLARDIEKVAGLPQRWLDDPRGGTPESVVNIPVANIEDCLDVAVGKVPSYQFVAIYQSRATRNLPSAVNVRHLMEVWSEGDSMSPTILPGDMVTIDRSMNAPADGLFLIDYSGPMFRRLQKVGPGIRLICDNKAYETIELDRMTPKLKLIGRVIQIGTFRPVF